MSFDGSIFITEDGTWGDASQIIVIHRDDLTTEQWEMLDNDQAKQVYRELS